MNAVRYHCSRCGFVTTTKTYLTKHDKTCNASHDDRLMKLRKQYQNNRNWFEVAIDENRIYAIADLQKRYAATTKSIVTLFRSLMVDVDESQFNDLAIKRLKYQDEIDTMYSNLLTRMLDRSNKLARIDGFINDRISPSDVKTPVYYDDDSLEETSDNSQTERYSVAATKNDKVKFTKVPTIVTQSVPPQSRLEQIRASRRSVGSRLPNY